MKKKPNIIMIVMDATRVDRLSCFGYHRNTTPNIDGISKHGAKFTSVIAPAVGTLSSVPSIMTGLYVGEHGVGPLSPRLSPSVKTLPQWLTSHGYETIGFVANPYLGHHTGLDRGFQQFTEVGSYEPKIPLGSRAKKWVQRAHRFMVTHRNDKGADYIIKNAKKTLTEASSSNRPLFAYFHFMEVHAPYFPPDPYFGMFLEDDTVTRGGALARIRLQMTGGTKSVYSVPGADENPSILHGLYDAGIAYLDKKIGELVHWLSITKILDDNSLLIITADHGENLGEHGMVGHGHCLYDTLLRVPMIVCGTPWFEEGTTIDALVQLHDVFSTIKIVVDPTSCSKSDYVRSLLPQHLDEHARDYAFAQDPRPGSQHLSSFGLDPKTLNRSIECVRSANSKLIIGSDGHHEYYDLSVDPSEEVNRYDVTDVDVIRLTKVLDSWRDGLSVASDDVAKQPHFDSAMMDRLRSLGYLE